MVRTKALSYSRFYRVDYGLITGDDATVFQFNPFDGSGVDKQICLANFVIGIRAIFLPGSQDFVVDLVHICTTLSLLTFYQKNRNI